MKFFPHVFQKLYLNSDTNSVSNEGNVRSRSNTREEEENGIVWDFLGKISVCIISVVYDMARYFNILPYSTLPVPEEELKDDPRDCVNYPKEEIKWYKWFDLYFVVFNGFCLSFCVVMNIDYETSTAIHYFYAVVYFVTGSHWLISLTNVERQVVLVNQVMWLVKKYSEVSRSAYLRRLWRMILIFIPLLTLFCISFVIMNLSHILHCRYNHGTDDDDPNWKIHSWGWMAIEVKEMSPKLIFWGLLLWEVYFVTVSIVNVLLGIFQLVIFRIQANAMQSR